MGKGMGMTQEELKKKQAEEQPSQPSPSTPSAPITPSSPTSDTPQPSSQQGASPGAYATNAAERSAALRRYASSPIDTSLPGRPSGASSRPYDEFIKSEYARRLQETPEQQQARERRERRDRRIAALADGFNALANLTGAMFGAKPIRQASLSAAHKKAVDEAARRRRDNAEKYEIARRYAQSLQLQKDKADADLYLKGEEARRKAAYQADDLDYKAATLQQKADDAKAKADRDKAKAKLDEEKFNETKRHNQATEATDRIRAAKAGSGGSGKKKSGDLTAAYDYWMSLTPEQKQQYRDWNNRKTGPIKDGVSNIVGYKYKPDDEKFIELVYNQRKAWLRNNGNKPKPTVSKPKPTVSKPKPTAPKPKPTAPKPKPTAPKPKRNTTASNGKKPTGVNWK